MEKKTPSLSTLRRLRPLAEFDTDKLLALAGELEEKTALKKEQILALGETNDDSLFVLSGDFVTTSVDGKQKKVSVADEELLNPLAQLRPSMYKLEAINTVQYLKIPKLLLTQFSSYGETDASSIDFDMMDDNSTVNDITLKICKDMMSDELSLPSLPEVALKIQQVYQDDLADMETIVNLLMADPAISAKLIKIANSVVYQGAVPTETLKSAIMRLGIDTTYKQVMAYAAHDLFNSSSSLLKERMSTLWAHSRKVAAISWVLADETKLFNPDLAMLAGLVHDLGIIVILEYLEKEGLSSDESVDVDDVVDSLRPLITGMLMNKWNFTDETKTVAEECEEWFRNPDDAADLCDIVMLAQYHAFIGTEEMKGLPLITTLPAMKKLGLNPVDSIALIRNSKDKIKAMEEMFK